MREEGRSQIRQGHGPFEVGGSLLFRLYSMWGLILSSGNMVSFVVVIVVVSVYLSNFSVSHRFKVELRLPIRKLLQLSR